MKQIDISFVFPVYNTEKFLSECIESILSDTSRCNIEIIVVDDCSPGNCAEIVKRYPTVRYIRHDMNRSAFQARWTGFKSSRGQYLYFIDPDDFFVKTNFAKSLTKIHTSGADIYEIKCLSGTSPESATAFGSALQNGRTLSDNKIFQGLENRDITWNLTTKFIRRSLIEEVSKLTSFDGAYINMADDLCFFSCLILFAKKYVLDLDDTVYFYRRHCASITSSQDISIKQHIQNLSDYKNCLRVIEKFYCLASADRAHLESIRELHFGNIHWYGQRLSNISQQAFNQLAPFILDAFDQELTIEYLITEHFSKFAGYLKEYGKQQDNVSHNIAIVVTSLGGGGTERVAVNLANLLQKHNFNVSFITISKHPQEFVIDQQCTRFIVPGLGRERYIAMADVLDKQMIDTLIFVDYFKNETFDDILWARAHGYKCIAMEHNVFLAPFYVASQPLLSKRLAAYTTCHTLTCLSPMDEQLWRASGVPQTYFTPNPLTFSIRPATASRNPTIVFAARLIALKGTTFLLDIMQSVVLRCPQAKLEICGSFSDPDDEKKFLQDIATRKLEKNISLLGYVTDIGKILEPASVFILPSYFEGFPMVLFEAKAYGVPAVIFDMQYLMRSSEHDGCYQVPLGDTQAFAQQIIALLVDAKLWDVASERARASLNGFEDSEILKYWLRYLTEPRQKTAPVNNEMHIFMHEFHKAIDYQSHHPEALGFATKDTGYITGLGGSFIHWFLNKINVLFPTNTRRRALLRRTVKALIRH